MNNPEIKSAHLATPEVNKGQKTIETALKIIDNTERFVGEKFNVIGAERTRLTDEALVFIAEETVKDADQNGKQTEKESSDIIEKIETVIIEGALEETGAKTTCGENPINDLENDGFRDEITDSIIELHNEDVKLPSGKNVAEVAVEVIERAVNEEKIKFDNAFNNYSVAYNKTKEKIEKLEQNLKSEQSERRIEIYTGQLANARRVLRIQGEHLEFMRIPKSREDSKNRAKIMNEFPKQIKESVPENLPLVFHGTDNIGAVREIIKSNGLLTPEQKGESMTSFASQIDVTSKTNISTSCRFAEPNGHTFMPYGAIFAFLPKPDEISKVNETGESTEVSNGVDGVNFANEPERLYGIITTPENIERVSTWCEQYGLDETKVFSHDSFLAALKNM